MSDTRFIRNIGLAMGSSVVNIAISLLVLPFYLRFLGVDAYGLIAFYTVIQSVSQVLDMGLAPTMSREVARASGRQHVSDLLHTLGVVYLGIAVLIVVLSVVVAPWVGHHWLDSKTLSPDTIIKAVLLMGLNLACRWPISLYQAALIGAHRLGLSSAISIVINVSGAIITIAILAYVSRSIEVFFLVQACMGLLHFEIGRAHV